MSRVCPPQSILPAVVRRILLKPKSDPGTESHSEPSTAPPQPSTAHVPTRSYKDGHGPPPPPFTSLTSWPPALTPTPLLQPHSSPALPEVCQTHSHLEPLHLIVSPPGTLFSLRPARRALSITSLCLCSAVTATEKPSPTCSKAVRPSLLLS